MNSESLISALTNIPVEVFDFDEVIFNEQDGDNESVDSLGSCCNSPNQSSDASLSPSADDSPSIFVFPSPSDKHQDTSTPKCTEKSKRKMECKVKRNERERRRVRRLADGFRKLREVVPGNYKKLSKLDTLKRALDYMSGLADILQSHNAQYGRDYPFIKQESHQYPSDYPSYIMSYQSPPISYQGSPEWTSLYQENSHMMVPCYAAQSQRINFPH